MMRSMCQPRCDAMPPLPATESPAGRRAARAPCRTPACRFAPRADFRDVVERLFARLADFAAFAQPRRFFSVVSHCRHAPAERQRPISRDAPRASAPPPRRRHAPRRRISAPCRASPSQARRRMIAIRRHARRHAASRRFALSCRFLQPPRLHRCSATDCRDVRRGDAQPRLPLPSCAPAEAHDRDVAACNAAAARCHGFRRRRMPRCRLDSDAITPCAA